MRLPASGAARSPPRPPRSTRTAIATVGLSTGAKPMNHECGSPLPPSSAVPDLPAVGTPRTFAPAVNCWPSVALDRLLHRRLDRPGVVHRSGPGASTERVDRPRPGPLARDRRTRCGVISTPSFATVDATSAIWSGVTNVSPWPNEAEASSDVVGEPAGRPPSPLVTRLTAVGRSNGIASPKPSSAAPSTSRSPPVWSPASAYQMLQLASVAPVRSSAVSPVCGWWPSRIRKPSTSEPVAPRPPAAPRTSSRARSRPVSRPAIAGHDLEHRARHVPAQRRAREQRVGVVVAGARRTSRSRCRGWRCRTRRRPASRRGRAPRPSSGRASRPRPGRRPARRTAARWRRRSSGRLEAERLVGRRVELAEQPADGRPTTRPISSAL